MGWIGAVVAVVGSYAGSQQQKKAAEKANKQGLAMTDAEARLQRENSQFDAEQNYYYDQLGRQNKQRGLDIFRKMSTTSQFAPQVSGYNPRIVLPDKPEWGKGKYAAPPPLPKRDKHWTLKDMFTKPSLDPANILGNNDDGH